MGLFSKLFSKDPEKSLLEAVKNLDAEKVQQLINEGTSVDQIINEPPLHGNASLLHLAVDALGDEKLRVVHMLLAKTSHLEHENALGYTPLATPLLDEDEEITEALLDAGANPLAMSDRVRGAGVLTTGLRMINQDLLTKVLDRCGAINFDTSMELSLLDTAIQKCSPKNVLLFLSKCPDETKHYLLSKSRLVMAVGMGDEALVRAFLDNGIEIALDHELIDENGQDLATWVEKLGHHKIAELLRERDISKKGHNEGSSKTMTANRQKETQNVPSEHQKYVPHKPDLFLQRIRDHRTRIVTASLDHKALLDRYLSENMMKSLSSMAREKMGLTNLDRKVHSIAVTEDQVGYCIYTIPIELDRGSEWFENEYGGYTKLINQLAVQPAIKAADAGILFHLIYGQASSSDELWFNMTMVGLGQRKNEFMPILAIDLLSTAEKEKMGMS